MMAWVTPFLWMSLGACIVTAAFYNRVYESAFQAGRREMFEDLKDAHLTAMHHAETTRIQLEEERERIRRQ